MATKHGSKGTKASKTTPTPTKDLRIRKGNADKVKGGLSNPGQVRGGPVMGQEDL